MEKMGKIVSFAPKAHPQPEADEPVAQPQAEIHCPISKSVNEPMIKYPSLLSKPGGDAVSGTAIEVDIAYSMLLCH